MIGAQANANMRQQRESENYTLKHTAHRDKSSGKVVSIDFGLLTVLSQTLRYCLGFPSESHKI